MSVPVLPVAATVALAHAEVQAIAEDCGVDLLHIKGPALDESLRRPWPEGRTPKRFSVDADVLVRPEHVSGFCAALAAHGWRCLYDFADGSAFQHASTWGLDGLACVDVHRYFPGIEGDPGAAFDVLWAARGERLIGGLACPVPALAAQRLIVLVHAARGRSARDDADRQRAWFGLDEESRTEVDALADQVSAKVALRAGTDRLDSVRGERTYPLWRYLTTEGGSLPGLWWARVRSAPSTRARLRVGVRMLLPNPRRMQTRFGRPATRREMVTAYGGQFRRGVRAVTRAIRPGSTFRP